jgi:hypothetical protein
LAKQIHYAQPIAKVRDDDLEALVLSAPSIQDSEFLNTIVDVLSVIISLPKKFILQVLSFSTMGIVVTIAMFKDYDVVEFRLDPLEIILVRH